jgi:hypothetical protein
MLCPVVVEATLYFNFEGITELLGHDLH